mgnify:CR=1 FL=1
MTNDVLQLVILLILVAVTCYTDWTSRRIPNKALLLALVPSLVLHAVNGTIFASVQAMVVCFVVAFIFYVTRMVHISPGDVKLLAVLGAITADLTVMFLCWFFFGVFHLIVAIWALWRETKFKPRAVMRTLKLDFVSFVTRTTPVIQPIRLPAAIPIGIGSVLAYAIAQGVV